MTDRPDDATPDNAALDWPALLAGLRANPGMTGHGFKHYMQDLRGKDPTAIGFGPSLARAAEVLNRGLLMGQGGEMGKVLTLLRASCDAIATADDAEMRARPASSQALLSCALVSEAGGYGAWPDLVSLGLQRLTPVAARLDTTGQGTVFAQVAHGQIDAVASVFGLTSAPAAETAGDRFLAPLECLRQIALTIRDTDPDAASPAWKAYLLLYPKALKAGHTNWNELLWTARAVLCVLHGHPAPDIPARLLAAIDAL